jgi:predicted negative regulator of RcsB-dependent stress response
MAEYNSDEERFSAIINFFNDYKVIILSSLATIIISLVSITAYQSFEETRNSEAAVIYDSWLAELDSNNENAKESFDQLQDNFSRTGYAQLAKMINGSNLARQGNFDNALENFIQLSNDTSGYFGNKVLNSVAKINIARIELSNKNYTNVLEALDSFASNSEHPMVYEIKGDALVGMKKEDLAIEQYKLAIENVRDESQKSILNIKINSIQL